MITFRPIEPCDLPLLKQWRNSDQIRNYVREYRLLNDSDQEKWYSSLIASRRTADSDQEILIMEDGTGNGIGVAGFTRIEWRNRKGELTFYCIKDELRKQALMAIISKGFNEFGFHKIYWPVYSHDPNIFIYQSILDTEAVLRDEYWWDGKWNDRIYLSKLNPVNLDKV